MSNNKMPDDDQIQPTVYQSYETNVMISSSTLTQGHSEHGHQPWLNVDYSQSPNNISQAPCFFNNLSFQQSALPCVPSLPNNIHIQSVTTNAFPVSTQIAAIDSSSSM
jgi:hypothetical protein